MRCVDSLVQVVFPSYLFKTATSGETGLSAGAEGATAPETLRQKDRVTGQHLERDAEGLP